MIYKAEYGELTEERKNEIELAIIDGRNYGYDLKSEKHRYFFVDKFYKSDYKKITKYAPMGSRIFDLTKVLETNDIPESVEDIANILSNKTWE